MRFDGRMKSGLGRIEFDARSEFGAHMTPDLGCIVVGLGRMRFDTHMTPELDHFETEADCMNFDSRTGPVARMQFDCSGYSHRS